ncbi:Hypothetical protein GSB_153716, partial [Giardia duodenalis]
VQAILETQEPNRSMAVIEDRQRAFIAQVPAQMASSAHRMNGQTSIAEAAQLEIECLSPGRQPCHPQQHTEPDGQGPSGLKFVCWEAPGTGGSGARLG